MSKGRPAVWLFSVTDPVTSMLEKRLFLIFAAYLYGAALHGDLAQFSTMLNQSRKKTVAAYPKKSGA